MEKRKPGRPQTLPVSRRISIHMPLELIFQMPKPRATFIRQAIIEKLEREDKKQEDKEKQEKKERALKLSLAKQSLARSLL